MATTFLNLELPTVTVTLGPTWATQVNAAFEVIDSHDHSSGKGVKVPTAGLNINADLDFNEQAALSLKLVNFEDQLAAPSGTSFASSMSTFSGDLYYTNDSGVAIQLTDGGGIVSLPGNAQIVEPQNVASDLTIAPSSTFVYLIVNTTASRSITLPEASAVTAGRIYIIKDATGTANTNNITVNRTGSDLIDGLSTQVLDSNNGSWMLVTDGDSNWFIS